MHLRYPSGLALKGRLTIAAGLGGALSLAACALAVGSGAWFSTQSMPIPIGPVNVTPAIGFAPPAPTGFSQAGAELRDGRVLVAGEHDGAVYNPTTQSWTKTGPLFVYRYGLHTLTVLPSGDVLVVGGYNDPTKGAAIYNPSDNSWVLTSAMHFARNDATATLLSDGNVLVAGGWACSSAGDCSTSATAESYDQSHGAWSDTTPMNVHRQDAAAVRLQDGKVLVSGGLTCCPYAVTATAELYDPKTGNWSPTGSMKSPREYHTLTLLNDGRVLAVGGDDFTRHWQGSLNSAELYDPTSGSWHAVAAMASARRFHASTFLADGRVLVTGGENAGQALASTEIYDPNANQWTSGGDMSRPRAGHSAFLLRNDQVLIAGGNDLRNPTTSAELYQP
jgi:N-acetylneuraminic acid mutarotase